MLKISLAFTSLLLGFAILGVVVSSIGVSEIIDLFSKFSPLGLIPLLALTAIIHIVGAAKWQYILRNMGIRASLIPLTKILLAGYAISYITPVVYIGGEFFRGHILRERYGVPLSRALSSIFIDKFLEAAVWISVIFASAMVFVFHSGISSLSSAVGASLLLVVFLAGFLGLVYLFSIRRKSLVRSLFLRPLKSKNSSLSKFLQEIEDEFFAFFSYANKRHIFGALKIALLKYVLLWVRNVLLIFYLVKGFSFSASLMALGFSYLSYTAPIPAALGAQEGLLSLIFSAVGFEASLGAVFTFLLRGAEIIAAGFGIYFLFRWGLGRFMFRISQWVRSLSLNGKVSR